METDTSLTEEYFSDYENVRRNSTTNMYDTRAISQNAGIPEDAVTDIQRNYVAYKETFGYTPLSEHALTKDMHTCGFITAGYRNLVYLYGGALVYREERMRPFATWFVITQYGAVQIFSNEYLGSERQYDDKSIDMEHVTAGLYERIVDRLAIS